MSPWRALLAAALLSNGCGGSPTQTLVHVEVEPALIEAARSFQLVIWDHEGDVARDESFRLGGSDAEVSFPAIIPVSPNADAADRTFAMQMVLLDEAGAELAVQRVSGRYTEGVRSHILLRFTSSCEGACSSEERCVAGECISDCAANSDERPTGPSPAAVCATNRPACFVRQPAAIGLGARHGCMVDEAGRLYCWGGNDRSQLARMDVSASALPSQVAGLGWTQVAVGKAHNVALMGVDIFSWGDTDHGQSGRGGGMGDCDNRSCWSPTASSSALRSATRIFAGGDHTLAVDPDGQLRAWGLNEEGQLSLEMEETFRLELASPQRVECQRRDDCSEPIIVQSVCAGDAFSCVVDMEGRLFCFGSNADGQLGVGLGEEAERGLIQQVGAAADWEQVACGGNSACALRGGDLFCWGGAEWLDGAATPSPFGDRTDWHQIVLGDRHACGLTQASELFCWGDNSALQLGVQRPSGPELSQVAGLFVQSETRDQGRSLLAAGFNSTCAVREDSRRLVCWGQNDQGQLGRGIVSPAEAPEPVCFTR